LLSWECASSASYSIRQPWKRLNLFAAKVVTDALSEFLSGQKASRFNNRSLAMDPLWLYAVEPGTLSGQPARNDADTLFAVFHFVQLCLIVLTQPGSDVLAHMPGGVIPNQHQHAFTLREEWHISIAMPRDARYAWKWQDAKGAKGSLLLSSFS
jgi:hypothetical protein